MKKRTYILTFCLIALGIQNSIAQTNVNDTITVRTKFTPTLSDANKINFNAQILDPNAELPKTHYFKSPVQFGVEFKPKQIKPAKFKGPKTLEALHKGLVIAGLGNYLSPYAEFFYNTTRSRKHNSGLHLKHHSAWGHLNEVFDPDFNENLVDIYTRQFFKGYVANGNISYHKNGFNLYGLPDSIAQLIDIDNLRQNHSKIEAAAKIEREFDVHEVNFNAGIKYQYWYNAFNQNEHQAAFNTKVYKEVDFTPAIKYHNLGLKANVDFLQQNISDSNSTHQFITNLTPFTTAKIKEFDFDVGLGINFITDSATNAFVRPIINVKLQLIENIAHAFVGYKGGIITQSFDKLAIENPFINSNQFYVNTKENFNIYGGFVTSIGKNLDFTAKVCAANYDNYVFFVNDTNNALGNMFSYVTDDDVSIFSVNSQLGFHIAEKLRAVFSLGYYNYSPSKQEAAWHKPSFDGSLAMSYNLRNKIIVNAGMYTFANAQARTFDDQNDVVALTLPAPFDINLGVEYRFSKTISAFMNLNNITAAKYSYWYNYPNQRFNMMAGVKYGL